MVTELTNGPTICSDVTATDTSCIVNLPRDVYNVTVIQTNDIGSTVDSNMFNSQCLNHNLCGYFPSFLQQRHLLCGRKGWDQKH